MNKLKDFFYNHNDIAIACVIVIIAAFVIVTRVDILMDYPAKAAADAIAKAEAELPSDPDIPVGELRDPELDPGVDLGGDDPVEGNDPVQDEPEPPVTDEPPVDEPEPPVDEPEPPVPDNTPVTITIPSGSTGADVAEALLKAGLISDKNDFYTKVVEMEADTKLQAGTFEIPKGSSLEEIVNILTR